MDKKTKIIKLGTDVLSLSRKSFSDKLLKLKEEGCLRIGIDLSEKPYLNSETLGVLAYNFVVLHDFGVELFFANPDPSIISVIKNTGLDKVIKIEYT